MSLDGLRAWIGVVERKLTMRTRVFLVLVALAIGGAGAAVYLAIDAQDNAVSESDLQEVRDELAESAVPGESPESTQLESELEALQVEVATLRGEADSNAKESGGTKEPSGDSQSAPEDSTGGASAPEK